MTCLVTLLLTLLLASHARAEIWSWEDADGVRRFTNRADSIPDADREQARVMLAEPPTAEVPVSAAPEGPKRPAERGEKVRRLAEIVYERSASQEYVEGLLDDMQRKRSERNTATAITSKPKRATPPVVIVPPMLRPRIAQSAPLVSSGFDAGRERHITMRMRLQDQYRLESCRNDPSDWIYSWTTTYRPGRGESSPTRRGGQR